MYNAPVIGLELLVHPPLPDYHVPIAIAGKILHLWRYQTKKWAPINWKAGNTFTGRLKG